MSHWTDEVEMKVREGSSREGGKDDMQSRESLTDVAKGEWWRIRERGEEVGGVVERGRGTD